MTHAIATTSRTVTAHPTRAANRTRTLLTAGILAGPLFEAVGLIGGATRKGFSFDRNAISQLSLGSMGWIQVTSFVVCGTLLVAGAIGVRRALAAHQAVGTGRTWVPRLLAVFGASLLVCSVFKADPGNGFPVGTPAGPAATMSGQCIVHLLSGFVGFSALCVALFILARRYTAEGRRGRAITYRAVAVLTMAAFPASGGSVAGFTVCAGLGMVFSAVAVAHIAAARTTV